MKRRKTSIGQILRNKLVTAARLSTSHFRVLPSFLIIGTARGGTTSLFHYLTLHPQVAAPLKKEIAFFCTHYHKGINRYRLHFPFQKKYNNSESRKITGEASPYYLSHPLAPERVRKMLPNVQLIVLLRNPVERAYSSYQNIRKLGLETLSFEDAISHEKERIFGEKEKMILDPHYYSSRHQHYSYVERGIYHEEVARWLKHFPRNQFLFLSSEEFYKNPSTVYRQVTDFLKLKDYVPEKFKVYNESSKSDPIPNNIRSMLAAFYAPHNEILFKMLGKRFEWQ